MRDLVRSEMFTTPFLIQFLGAPMRDLVRS